MARQGTDELQKVPPGGSFGSSVSRRPPMKTPPLKSEARRLAELRGHEILDTAPEEAFERAVRMAAQIFQVPVSTVTFVDEFRQWFKASVGMPFRESPRQHSYCALTILREGV